MNLKPELPWQRTFVKDISTGGIRIITKDEFAKADLLNLRICISSIKSEWIIVNGSVAESVKEPNSQYIFLTGLRFIDLSADHKQSIEKFIAANKFNAQTPQT